MNLTKLENLPKLLFTIDDIAKIYSISEESAKVKASRYVNAGYIIRIKRDLYITTTKFNHLTEKELFQIANFIQTPSYVSLTTALSYYNISTQQTQNFIESVATKRTKKVKIRNVDFVFTLINYEFYKGFEKQDNFFIAAPEKALADTVYLSAFGKYSLDYYALDLTSVNLTKVENYLSSVSKRAINYLEKLCENIKT